MIGFTNTRREIINLNTNTSYVDGDIASSINAIGEKKRLIFDYTVDAYDSIENYVFYINLAMFMPKGVLNPIKGKGEIYWQAVIPSLTGPLDIVCDIVSSSTITPKEAFKNYSVTVSISTSTTFQIIVDFYNTFDTLGYMANELALLNVDRFLKDRYNNPQQLVKSGQNIYTNTNYDGRVYLYAENIEDKTDFGSIETLFGDYKVNFYGGYPWVYGTEPDVSFGYTVDGVSVETLNNIGNTKVTVQIYCPDYTPTLYIMAFKKDKADNTIDFVENASIETKKIEAGTTNGDLIVGPFTLPTDFGFGTWDAEFYVNYQNLELGDELYFVAMVYNPDKDIVSSFIAKTPPTAGENPYNGAGMNFEGSLLDYNKEFTGHDLECVVEERMGCKVLITYPLDQYKNDLFNRLGITVPNNILTYLTKIRFQIYEEVTAQSYLPYSTANNQTVLNYVDEREMVKAKNHPQIFSGQTSEFSAIVGTESLLLLAYWRNRYEDNIPCLRSLIDGIDYGSKLMTQHWGGHFLQVRWELEFFYDNIDSPFTDIIAYEQRIRVKSYEDEVQIVAQEPENEDLDFRCLIDTLNYQTEFTPPDASTYKVIQTIEVAPGGINTIEEGENWAGATLVQQTTTKVPIATQEHTVGQTVTDAQLFELDGLVENTYKVSSIVKAIL